jgi:glycosyltransferase involved in cell wall biosynthesis
MNERTAALVSVVVPVKNGAAFLRGCLDSIFRQTYANFEVIVVNDGSSDASGSIAVEFTSVRVVDLSGLGSSAAKNAGVDVARGEYVAFTDADCIVDQNWLSELVRGMEDGVENCGGSQHSPADQSNFGNDVHRFFETVGFVSEYYKTASKIVDCDHNPTCNAMFRTETLRQMNGFIVDLWPCEDLELDWRLRRQKGRIRFNPLAKVYHYRPSHFGGLMRMIWRYGAAHAKLVHYCGFYRRLHFLAVAGLFLSIVVASAVYIWGLSIFQPVFLLTGVAGWLYFLGKTHHFVKSVRFLEWTVCAATLFMAAFWSNWFKYLCKRLPQKNKTLINRAC